MNIFVLDEVTWKAAQMLDDQRLSKMIIESGQMLRAALARHGFTEEDCIEHHILTSKGTPWRVTHANHPCTIWAGDCRANFEWLAHYAECLCNEHWRRSGHTKWHACEQPILGMSYLSERIPETTPFVLAMPDEFKVPGDAVESYRRYFRSKPNVRYSRVEAPDWYEVSA